MEKSTRMRPFEEYTPDELWDHVEKMPVYGRTPNGYLVAETVETAPGPWSGNVTMAGAIALARNGWPEGLEKVAPVLARVEDLIAHSLPEPVMAWDVSGDTPDVGAYLSGVPENMITTEEAEGSARMVRVIVNVGALAGVSPATIEARGIIACALVDALERAGYRVELIAAHETRGDDGTRYGKRILLKRAEEVLSLDRIVFVLISPAFLRRILFRCLELLPDETRRGIGSGYGQSQPVVGAPGDIVIGELTGGDWTPENCTAEVIRYLAEVGVHVDNAQTVGA